MRISNRTVYAIAGTLVLLVFAVRSQSDRRPAPQDSLSLETSQDIRPASSYDAVRRSTSSTDRAASGVARIPVTSLPAPRTTVRPDNSSSVPVDFGDDEAIPQASAPPPEPAVTPGDSGFSESGALAEAPPSEPARAGDLTDQAVYELYVSSLDEENRRAFRTTWAVMSPEERQDWLQGARAALSGS
ncbi:hypothetical protein BH11ARM2_BH11ARM2_33720 [soil metagenome]